MELLPPETQMRWILRRSATLLRLGAEPVRGLVLPTAEFFPDEFDKSPKSVAALLTRIQEHAGLKGVRSELAVVTPEGETQTVSCSSGACGVGQPLGSEMKRIERRDDGSYIISVASGEIGHPVAITTTLVRAVAFMFMTEVFAYDELRPEERDAATDLAATLLGFGVLIANGSYIYVKSCGGVQVHAATTMPAAETALALAVFCALHRIPTRSASKHLDVTPGEHFDEAAAWAGSNAPLIRLLRDDPSVLEEDDYKVAPARSWLARTLGIGRRARAARPTEGDLAELERSLKTEGVARAASRPVDPAKSKRLAEIRALVDEGLDAE